MTLQNAPPLDIPAALIRRSLRARRSRPSAAAARARPSDAVLADLLRRVAGGDRKALQALYRHTAPFLNAVCLRILREEPAAEDALQETYLCVWRRAGSFQAHRGAALTWLTAVARNQAIDRLRMIRSQPAGSDECLDGLIAAEPAADRRLEQAESDAWIHRQLDRLHPDTAWALKSAFFHGFTYAELARRAGVPEATMKSRIRRALLHLRTSWTEDSAYGAT